MSSAYNESSVPSVAGKTFFITGANTGIGFETARVLAARGGDVWIGCRSENKGVEACERIRQLHPKAQIEFVILDLANLSSVREAAQLIAARPRLDVLINNAGVMIPPFSLTVDGFESQFGTNHLGHFALTGLLLPKLMTQPKSRVVSVASSAHKFGKIDFDDIDAKRRYSASARYAMSKLANLLFTFELQRRLAKTDRDVLAVACHPGGADTELARHIPSKLNSLIRPLAQFVINSPAEGALPTLRASTDDAVVAGEYYGPAGWFEIAHSAVLVKASNGAHDEQSARRLWDLSVERTGVDPFANNNSDNTGE